MTVKTILVADDFEDNRLVLKNILKKEDDIKIIEACNGQEAVDLAKKHIPNLILMDIMMPVKDGLASIKELREYKATSRIPIVAVTALDSTQDKLESIAAGAIDFVTKPIDPIEIKQRIRTLLALHGSILERENELKCLNEQLEKKVLEKSEALIRHYRIDTFTELPNRVALNEFLENGEAGYLLQIKVSQLDDLHIFYGHEPGDMLVLHLANLLKDFAQKTGNLAFKFSSNAFMFFIRGEHSKEHIERLTQKMLKLFDENPYILLEEIKIYPKIYIGGAHAHPKGIQNTTSALSYAKKNNTEIHLYDNACTLASQSISNLKMIETIKNAIKQDGILVYHQPIVDLQNHTGKKYECLMRMRDREGNIVAPGYFLPIAMRSGLYPKLTEILIHKVFEHFPKDGVCLNLNLSVLDIQNKKVVDKILDSLAKIPAEKCTFEITESEGLENYEEAKRFISRIKQSGAKIAIDDFGSGYSNFSHLMELDVDFLKIDGSLIKHLDTNKNAVKVVKAIVDFASKLGIKTVAEFVHNETIHTIVKELGCDMGQGYYYGAPQPTY